VPFAAGAAGSAIFQTRPSRRACSWRRRSVSDTGHWAAGDHLAESVTDHLGIDHHVAEPDVGQEPALGVPLLDVELEPHVLGVRQAPIELQGLTALWLAGVGTAVAGVRRGHPDVADALDVAVDEDVDGVAAHDLHDRGGQAAWLPRLLAPGGRDQEEQERAREQEAPERSRHYLRPSLSERSRASRRRRSAASWSVSVLSWASRRWSSSVCVWRLACSWAPFAQGNHGHAAA
jgi:hypothetical protein